MRTMRRAANILSIPLAALLLVTLPVPPAVAQALMNDKAISIIKGPTLIYPAASRRQGEQGKVGLRVVVGADGLPKSVRVIKSSGYPRLDQAAIDGYMHAVFTPYIENGAPIEVATDGQVQFRLEDNQDDMSSAIPGNPQCGAAVFTMQPGQRTYHYQVFAEPVQGAPGKRFIYDAPAWSLLYAGCTTDSQARPMLVLRLNGTQNYGLIDPASLRLVLAPGPAGSSNAAELERLIGHPPGKLRRAELCCGEPRQQAAQP